MAARARADGVSETLSRFHGESVEYDRQSARERSPGGGRDDSPLPSAFPRTFARSPDSSRAIRRRIRRKCGLLFLRGDGDGQNFLFAEVLEVLQHPSRLPSHSQRIAQVAREAKWEAGGRAASAKRVHGDTSVSVRRMSIWKMRELPELLRAQSFDRVDVGGAALISFKFMFAALCQMPASCSDCSTQAGEKTAFAEARALAHHPLSQFSESRLARGRHQVAWRSRNQHRI